jgi:hypothetical protein
MMSADKQLEAIRKEHKDLTDSIKRTAILVLTVCSLITISFARACKKTRGDESRTTLCKIHKANKIAGSGEVQVSYIFEMFEPTEKCDAPCQLPDTSAEATQVASQSSVPAGEAVKQQAVDCQTKLEADIEERARGWFRLSRQYLASRLPSTFVIGSSAYRWSFFFPASTFTQLAGNSGC